MKNLIEQRLIISGIYKITCKNNSKFYVGSSTNIDKRLKEHVGLLKRNNHPNKYLQNCWNKYGEENFKFEIIETIHDINQLLIREKWWLDHTKCYDKKVGFNIYPYSHISATGKFVDLTGLKFNRLTVIKYMNKNKYGQSMWLCECDCGKKIIVAGYNLQNNNTKSCGCLQKEASRINGIKHNYSKTPTYHVWCGMKARCNNKTNKDYSRYGKRGIKVCKRWQGKNGFINFLKDMGEKPKGLTLDRIKNNLGYHKQNCRWVTPKKQNRNRKSNHVLKYGGKNLCFAEWEEVTGIKQETIRRRIGAGWSVKDALTIPVKIQYRKINK